MPGVIFEKTFDTALELLCEKTPFARAAMDGVEWEFLFRTDFHDCPWSGTAENGEPIQSYRTRATPICGALLVVFSWETRPGDERKIRLLGVRLAPPESEDDDDEGNGEDPES